MKSKIPSLVIAAAVLTAAAFTMLPEKAHAQSGSRYTAAPGTPPIGRLCEVNVIASVMSQRTEIQKVSGTLLAMTDQWIVLQEGTFENWVPREKVVTLRASR